MRIRQIKPAFWTDPTMARLTKPARLFYIGLWMMADDVGVFEWNTEQLGAELFPYDGTKGRVGAIDKWAEELVAEGRLFILECGHALIPTLANIIDLRPPRNR